MLYIDLKRVMRNPLMREAGWTFLGCIVFGLGWQFGREPEIREALLYGLILLIIVLAFLVIYLVISNTKLTHE